MADAQLPAKPKRIPGLPNNFQLLTFDGFDGLNTKPTRAGLKDQQCFVLDNFMPLGKSNVRTLYDVGGAIAHIDSTGQIQPGPVPVAGLLSFTIQPSQDLCAFGMMDNGVQVTAPDVTFTANVTIALGNNPSGATLSGTLTVAAVAGVADFTDLALDKAGIGYTLVATASGFTSATSASFDMVAAPNVVCFPNTYLEIDPLTIAATAERGLLMVWFYGVGSIGDIFANGPDASTVGTLEYAPQIPLLALFDSLGGSSVNLSVPDSAPFGQWNQDIIAWDHSISAAQWIRNGVLQTPTAAFGANVPSYTTFTHYFFNPLRADMAYSDFFFALPNAYFDLTNSANVAKLRTAGGNPVDISANPSAVCGVAPVVYFHNDPATYPTDRGTGGNFTVNGTALDPTRLTPWP